MSVRERIANFSGGNGSSLGKGVRGPSASPSWARKPSISSTSALSKGTATSGRVGKVNVPDVFRSATKRVDVSESLTSRGLSTSTLAEAPVGTEVEKMPTAGNTGDLSCGITGGSSSSSSAESSNGSASSAGGQSSENCASSGNKRTGSPGPGQSDGGASSLVSSSNHGSASPQMKSSSESGDGPEVRPQSNAATRRSRGDTRSDGSAANGEHSVLLVWGLRIMCYRHVLPSLFAAGGGGWRASRDVVFVLWTVFVLLEFISFGRRTIRPVEWRKFMWASHGKAVDAVLPNSIAEEYETNI